MPVFNTIAITLFVIVFFSITFEERLSKILSGGIVDALTSAWKEPLGSFFPVDEEDTKPISFEGFCNIIDCEAVPEFEEFDAEKHFHLYGGDASSPLVFRGIGKNVSALEKWKDTSYMLENLSRDLPDMPVLVTESPFIRGVDVFEDKEYQAEVLKSGPEWLFTDKRIDEVSPDATAYIGGVEFDDVSGLLADLEDIPYFMNRSKSSLPYKKESGWYGLWLGTGLIDSGLHFDENHGGFVLMIVGEKEVLLMRNSEKNRKNLYPDKKYKQYSSMFMAKELRTPSSKLDASNEDLGNLKDVHRVVLHPGDVLYIPHRWYHEFISRGQSISLTSWLKPS